MQESRGWAIVVAVAILKPLLLLFTKRRWLGGERLPSTGGYVIALNHLSHIDPLTAAHFVYDHGRSPHYLAKAGLFDHKVLGCLLRAAGQIPVERGTRNAVGAYGAAVRTIRDGRVVVVYPEATITRDPDLWPMTGKSGAARIALETGCPVIPVAQWGAQDILAPYAKKPDLFPRKTVTLQVGEPVDLDDLRGQPITAAVISEASERILAAITDQLELIRGESAPTTRYDMRLHGDRFKHGKRDDKRDNQ